MGTSFCFSETMEKDLGIFHSGTDFLFLFHLGKRKENIGSANKTYFNSKIVDVCKFESTLAINERLKIFSIMLSHAFYGVEM